MADATTCRDAGDAACLRSAMGTAHKASVVPLDSVFPVGLGRTLLVKLDGTPGLALQD